LTDRHAVGRQTEVQVDGQTCRLTDRHAVDRQTCRLTDRCAGRQTDIHAG